MNKIFKKIIALLLLLVIFEMPVFSKEKKIKMQTHITSDFEISDMPEEVEFKTIIKTKIFDDVTIPQRSIIHAAVLEAQKERRWHKSGYILCKADYYVTELGEKVDIEDKNLYFIVRKYEPVNKKEAAILGTEILLTQGASFFAPGVDILYFFTKGAILRKQRVNWFRAGVANAYENSICWFWLKGKPIDIEEGQEVQMKEIKEERVEKLIPQIRKRKIKEEIKNFKKYVKNNFKEMKREAKNTLDFEIKELSFEEKYGNEVYMEILEQTIYGFDNLHVDDRAEIYWELYNLDRIDEQEEIEEETRVEFEESPEVNGIKL